ncbi:hypothetical protein BDQ17DRAFT_1365350 [Cyathus striatus]|nr:hypothetical protein BDQ17DRAFT_1365350 [Cyathus striatus]
MVATGFTLTTWAVDMVMIWRFLVMYHDLKLLKWSIFVFSLLLEIGSTAFGVLQLFYDSSDHPSFTSLYLIGLEAFALFQNMLLTTLIVGRLLLARSRIRKVLGRRHGSEYINITTMLLESQVLVGAGQVGLLATGITPYGRVMYQIFGQLQVLAPNFHIYRVAHGKRCDTKMIEEISTLKFSHDDLDTQA